ncbi:MAG TPA: Gfo/Idh/MocA family oxidoreductase [Kofleriaceae bacterium]|nr:Gfo/Idh/MocA family oxidoreductase [Kofleriaceae bacterium]
MERKIRWGIISTALIATAKVIPGMQRSRRGTVDAIASRDAERARRVAAELGIARSYGSYEALLADPDIDAVYNPLPNNLHVDWTIAAASAGKHVLCEKPLGMDAEDAARLRAAAGERHIMEAFMVRFHPQWLRTRELVRAGRIGELRLIHVAFSYDNRDPDNIRNRPETGGGALLDIGCYGIVSGRFCFEAEPQRVMSLIERDPTFGTDRLSSVVADFGGGRRLVFTVSTQIAPHQRVLLAGTGGQIEIMVPFNAPQMEETRIRIDDGSQLGGGSAVEEVFPPVDQYAEEADAFARAVLGETALPYGVEDGIRNMQILDAIVRSERSGRWEPTGL